MILHINCFPQKYSFSCLLQYWINLSVSFFICYLQHPIFPQYTIYVSSNRFKCVIFQKFQLEYEWWFVFFKNGKIQSFVIRIFAKRFVLCNNFDNSIFLLCWGGKNSSSFHWQSPKLATPPTHSIDLGWKKRFFLSTFLI